jgi:hypothetical protein
MLLAYSIVAMWVLIGVGILCVGATWLTRSRTGATLFSSVAAGCVALALGCTAFWTWFLRDGLGGDSIPSHGILACQRFFEEFWVALLVAVLACSLVLVSWRQRVRRINNHTAG